LLKNHTAIVTVDEMVQMCLGKNLNFAVYKLPNSEKKEIIVQRGADLQYLHDEESDFLLKGFIVAPFSATSQARAFIIRPDIYFADDSDRGVYESVHELEPRPVMSDGAHVPEQIDHQGYLLQLNQISEKICAGKFEKVVLSRVKLISGNYIDSLPDIFSRLCDEYENAFVYMFNAGSHLWMGATPEPLLKARNGKMNTVSLAGTRPLAHENLNIGAWNSKERLEQEYVTRYITRVLSSFNLQNVELEGPYTKRAGNLVHLRTDFSFSSAALKNKLRAFLSELHPTPAVCGMPRKESLELIAGLEKHKREYYSGFLGPVGLNDQLTLFVNLRCMKVLADKLALFVGGGITSDSVPEEEWQETEIKAETLLSVIRKIHT
jgi:isochorismate synthase